MEKTELQKLFKSYMKNLGYRCKGNICHKALDSDYLVVVFLEHSSFQIAYRIRYGVIYEYDSDRPAPLTKTDWSSRFLFGQDREELFDYSRSTEEEFLRELTENVEKRLAQVCDREFVLDQYRRNWLAFRRIPYDTARKICRLAGLDYEEVVAIRDSKATRWPVTEE